MSLKAFHVLFITLAILMILGCGTVALLSYLESGILPHLIGALGAGFCALGLAVYECWFIRKGRGIV